MASVVGKTIFSDGKGKLFFGYYKTDDAVEFVDYKTWKKLNFKDVSKGDTNKERVIKAIVKNQKQFNKKVDFNMWAKKQKRSFEDTMDWFIQNGWVSNITKRGIKEGVEDVLSVNEGQLNIGDTIKVKAGNSLQKMNRLDDKWKVIKKDNSTYTLQKVGSSMKVRHPQTKVDYLIARPGQSQLPFIVESVNESVNEVTKSKNSKKIKELEALLKSIKSNTPAAQGRKAAIRDDIKRLKNESVNEAMKPSQVRSAISKVKKQLMRKWKQKGGYENFGQKELSQMKDKFDYNPYGSSDERQISKMLDGFDNWAMNYDGNMREDRNSNMFYVLYQKKGAFGKPAAAGYKDRKDAEKFAKSLGNNHNTMILDKQSMKNVKGVDVKEGKKRFKRQDGIGKSKYTISYHDGKKKHKDGSDFFDIKIFKNKKDLSDFVGTLVKQGYKLTNESVNESASREAMGIAALTGTRGSAVQDFIDKNRINSRKLFNALKKANLQGRINFASALAGKPGNPNEKLTIKLFGEDKGEVVALRKKAKSEKAFYDVLDKVEKKYGKRSFEKWLDKSLKDLKINPSKYRTSAEKQEALYQAKL